MKFSGKFSILLALVVAGLAVFSASRLLAPINQSRQELQLNWTEEIGRNVPPEFASPRRPWAPSADSLSMCSGSAPPA